ncbi:MAG TPA: efflux RND transporter periplasmic adaptor subunit [Puia sp.]|jgi:membrane fusion protein (multidrug efflux system)|nr:efflux RND transporter periplasmic adaptor subunit [Puia sp.]
MRKYLYSGMLVLLMEIVLDSCQSPVAGAGYSAPPPAILPVFKVSNRPFTTYREYTAALEGSKDIEIRPQVSGYIEKIFIDEGAFVKKDQPLFKINDQPYREALNNASASLAVAKANQASAEINMNKLEPLVQNQVISPIQLKTAKAAYDAATAYVAQAEAMVGNAKINIGYSLIKAPVDGYIGRIHIKIGSLAGLSSQDPLTNISEVRDVRAYFSVSETAFLRFKDEYPGKTIEDKIKNLPPVELILSDNNVYPEKGKVEMVSGQFAAGTGAIPFRASFPNPNGILRSGNTGRVRISVQQPDGLVIPQESTFELQDKVFVFVLGDSNKVTGTAIKILGRSGNYYLVENGVKAGDRIVYSGVDKLNDGAKIDPVPMSLDSLLKIRPM